MADYTTPTGQVRLLIADLAEPPIFDDMILEGYLAMHDYVVGDPDSIKRTGVWRAAADALDAIATSEALTSKKIRTQDLSTDGPAVAAELRKQAAVLRAKADQADAEADSFFEIIPFCSPGGPEGAEARW
ncbi:hypothetical protein [Paeniglutamicibacter gangotriensis]|uniref:Uncharacterized protein n=1 Tax=Paeniglutamicibacter gangotriensis Lz1y TaxID=1276920 RepID=M7N995_9MICC|nr:hypothetical protein [Paeniglutamicibacter gangotriensis]EMQ98349.1 hypothetical protein ADIAG_02367 [Paeniglutamicibacter gangotriensis Lz1y]